MADLQSSWVKAESLVAFPVRVAALCALTQIFDGYDTHVIGLAAPAIARSWGLAPAAFANAFVLSSLGILAGAVLAGPLGSRFGRKLLLVAGLALAGAASLVSASVSSLAALAWVRLAVGMGIGATLPATVAVLSDHVGAKNRANIVMFMFAGNTLGGFLGGQLAALLLPRWGWPSLFVAGGLAPLALLPALILLLPQAPRRAAAAEQAAARSDGPLSPAHASATLRLWVVFFANMLSMSLLTYWLPSILSLMHLEPGESAFAASIASAGGLAATVWLAALSARFGATATLAANLAAGAVFIALIGLADMPRPLLQAAIFLAGGCTFGCQLAANGLAATVYPASIRITGVGWALGAGRVGAFAGPALAGLLTAMNWPPRQAVLAGCVAALIAALAVAGLRPGGETSPNAL